MTRIVKTFLPICLVGKYLKSYCALFTDRKYYLLFKISSPLFQFYLNSISFTACFCKANSYIISREASRYNVPKSLLTKMFDDKMANAVLGYFMDDLLFKILSSLLQLYSNSVPSVFRWFLKMLVQ